MIERVGVRCAKGEEACAAAVTLGLCSSQDRERRTLALTVNAAQAF
jgi:hypothetical protein